MANKANKRRKTSGKSAGAAASEQSDREMITCDPKGDAILEAGNNISIRVNSNVLRLASSVFQALFSDRFVEGQNLSGTNPPALSFPEDDGQSLATLCSILHWNEVSIDGKDATAVMNLAILADKYNCIAPLKHMILDRIADFQPSYNDTLEELFKIVVCAYYMRDATLFDRSSLILAMSVPNMNYLVELESELEAFSPGPSLTRQVVGLYDHLHRDLCNCLNKFHTSVLKAMIRMDPSKTLDRLEELSKYFVISKSLQQCNEGIRTLVMTTNLWHLPLPQHASLNLYIATTPSAETRQQKLDEWKAIKARFGTQGLCLKCVTGGCPSFYGAHTHEKSQVEQ